MPLSSSRASWSASRPGAEWSSSSQCAMNSAADRSQPKLRLSPIPGWPPRWIRRMRSSSGTRSLTSAPSERMSSSVLLACCRRKHAIALGSHCLRSRVRHRQVTKGLPRAYLGSFARHDDLGFVLHGWRSRLSDKSRPEEFDGGWIFALELLPGDDSSVGARELIAEAHESQGG